ncbi:MAG: hypothetical protein IPL84_13805 [Chitinophagaceae bacterium]|nr:hypothetical protein [Chitinophagaceae bacterium]
MEDNNIDNKLDALKLIEAVDAPPFLLTRIRQRIQNQELVKAPVKWKLAFAFTSVVLLALNIAILFKSAGNNDEKPATDGKTSIETVVSSMNLSTSSNFYYE